MAHLNIIYDDLHCFSPIFSLIPRLSFVHIFLHARRNHHAPQMLHVLYVPLLHDLYLDVLF